MTINNDLTESVLKAQQEHKLQHDAFHIQPESNLDDHTHVLNHSNSFAIFDRWGNIYPGRHASHGIYHRGTRFINQWILTIDRQRPLLLGSTIKDDNNILSIDLTNPVLQNGTIPENTLHIFRHQLIGEDGFFERITCVNYNESDCQFELALLFNGDFKDIFEVRGTKRTIAPGPIHFIQDPGQTELTIIYEGKDSIHRSVTIKMDTPVMDVIKDGSFQIPLQLKAGEEVQFHISLHFNIGEVSYQKINFDSAKRNILSQKSDHDVQVAQLTSSNIQLNLWLDRAFTDLYSLQGHVGASIYPFAGVPWYNTPFGRDGLITAIETLWLAPHIAKNVLIFLAATQAKEQSPKQDAQPGKILHEAREGEMANTGEIPFKKYYGTVDATPLFIMLAGMYYTQTGDLPFIKNLWSAIENALNWIDVYGDEDKDGFVEYSYQNPDALTNQGWKDSVDAIMHLDGRIASGPIALCEVQGYVYAAKLQAAIMAKALTFDDLAEKLSSEALKLKESFNQIFWNENLQTYILALDGDKKPCNVIASNAGHALFTAIADTAKASKTADQLMSEDMYSGWGIRTLAKNCVKYNPMSYHNGSIWPHDNALIGLGLSRYGFKEQVLRLFDGFFQATTWIDLHRLPELFCGLTKRHCEGPTAYPVACSPQAWAVGSGFLLLQACLGLEINALKKTVEFNAPQLPDQVEELIISNLQLGKGSCIVHCKKANPSVAIQIEGLPKDWHFKIKMIST